MYRHLHQLFRQRVQAEVAASNSVVSRLPLVGAWSTSRAKPHVDFATELGPDTVVVGGPASVSVQITHSYVKNDPRANTG